MKKVFKFILNNSFYYIIIKNFISLILVFIYDFDKIDFK